MSYCTQQQVEAYLGRDLSDAESELFPTLADGVDDYIDIYCSRTFDLSRSKTFNVDSTVGDKSSNPFQSYDGGVYEIFLDAPVLTDVTLTNPDGSSAGVFKPYVGAWNTSTSTWTILDSTTYIMYPTNSSVKTSIEVRVGTFPYGINNIYVYGKFTDYFTPPEGIQLAEATLCANFYNMTDDLKSETIEGYARVMQNEWNPLVGRLLDNFKRVVL